MRGVCGAAEEPAAAVAAVAAVGSPVVAATEDPTEDVCAAAGDIESPSATYEARLSELAAAEEEVAIVAEEEAAAVVEEEDVAGGAAGGVTEAAAKRMKVAELRAELLARGLSTDGLKPALLERLLAALGGAPPPAASVEDAEALPVATDQEPQTPAPASSRARRGAGGSRLSALAAPPTAGASERRTSTRVACRAAA
eukprot:2132285-Prymnesium_polylepis.1